MPHATQPTISIAIATHNGEKFFFEQLESIRQQTVVPNEIVISDDNSSDETLAVVDRALPPQWRHDNGMALKILRNSKALGPGKNFEQAMSACTSDLIACADQDDLWVPNKLAVFVGVFSKNPQALLVHSDAELVDSNNTPMGMALSQGLAVSATELEALQSGHSLPAIIKRNLVTGATMMVKKELLELAFPLPREELHDGWLALVASLLDALVFVPEKLLHYRQHDSNQIGGMPINVPRVLEEIFGSWAVLMGSLKAHNTELERLTNNFCHRVSETNHEVVRKRIAHNAWRIGLPKSRIFRVWPVLWGVIRGRYAKYGRQPHDVVRDLLMPPHDLLLGFYRRLSTRKH